MLRRDPPQEYSSVLLGNNTSSLLEIYQFVFYNASAKVNCGDGPQINHARGGLVV